jgi:Mg-chelatase subunit ChlD
VFEPVSNKAGDVVFTATNPRHRNADPASGSGAPGLSDESAQLPAELPTPGSPEAETLARARQIAARLAIRRPRGHLAPRRGAGELASVAYTGSADELDLEATLEALVEHPLATEDDIVVRERRRTRRSVVLVVDASGSMRGERARTAAATVGALAGELARDDLAVIAFGADAAILAHLGAAVPADRILGLLLGLPARGLTNITFPLRLARRELARVPAGDTRVVLLSDCVHNAGPDPRDVAAGLARLDVLFDVTGEHDGELARDLARVGHGRLARISGYRDVAPVVSELFAR